MAISSDLMKAILSLDSYNRGYDVSITVEGTSIGNASIYRQSNILLDESDARKDIPASFYAIAYEFDNEIVVSYRGTDDIKKDSPNFLTGAGIYQTEQTKLAVEFYRAIDDLTTKNLSFTGHSLGGGLAGYVGSIFRDVDVVMFDNMPFELAAKNVYDNSKPYSLNGNDYPNGLNPALKNFIYGTEEVWKPVTYTGSGMTNTMKGYSLQGEVLEPLRSGQSTSVEALALAGSEGSVAGIGSGITGGGLHSMASLVIRMFADESEVTSTHWEKSAQYFWPTLYVEKFAKDIGFGGKGEGGADVADGKLRSVLAYSAINEGTRVFGDTGIRALYNDANDFGEVLATSHPDIFDIAGTAISKSFVHYAAHLAKEKVLQTANPTAVNGVLSLTSDALEIDFTDAKWNVSTSGVPANMAGRTALVDKVLNAGWEGATSVADSAKLAMQHAWSTTSYNVIEKVALSRDDDGGSVSITNTASTGKVILNYLSDGADDVTGSSGKLESLREGSYSREIYR